MSNEHLKLPIENSTNWGKKLWSQHGKHQLREISQSPGIIRKPSYERIDVGDFDFCSVR